MKHLQSRWYMPTVMFGCCIRKARLALGYDLDFDRIEFSQPLAPGADTRNHGILLRKTVMGSGATLVLIPRACRAEPRNLFQHVNKQFWMTRSEKLPAVFHFANLS